MDCLILGDSIAEGIAMQRKECQAAYRSGITSKDFLHRFGSKHTGSTVIISLGTNDSGIPTVRYLSELRQGIRADRVLWVLPSASIKPRERSQVSAIARHWQDGVIDVTTRWLSKDQIHLTGMGYRELANRTK